MPTLPETADVQELGGILVNLSRVEDPLTDLDAGADNKNRANTAAMTHTAIRALRCFTASSAPGDPSAGLVHDAVWGSGLALKPSVAYSAVGVWNVTWPAVVVDELGVSHTLVLRGAIAQAQGTTPYIIQTERLGATNAWRVRMWNFVAGVPTLVNGGAIVTLAVW